MRYSKTFYCKKKPMRRTRRLINLSSTYFRRLMCLIIRRSDLFRHKYVYISLIRKIIQSQTKKYLKSVIHIHRYFNRLNYKYINQSTLTRTVSLRHFICLGFLGFYNFYQFIWINHIFDGFIWEKIRFRTHITDRTKDNAFSFA